MVHAQSGARLDTAKSGTGWGSQRGYTAPVESDEDLEEISFAAHGLLPCEAALGGEHGGQALCLGGPDFEDWERADACRHVCPGAVPDDLPVVTVPIQAHEQSGGECEAPGLPSCGIGCIRTKKGKGSGSTLKHCSIKPEAAQSVNSEEEHGAEDDGSGLRDESLSSVNCNHPLQKVYPDRDNKSDGFTCDVCSADSVRSVRGQPTFYCQICDFAMCYTCFRAGWWIRVRN